jgi:hypothetical protein
MFGDISSAFGKSFLTAHLIPAGALCAAVLGAMNAGYVR